MNNARAIATGVLVMAIGLMEALSASAQGCVCQKQGSPVFGGLETYLQDGQWQLTMGYRGYRSTEHFRGTARAPELDGNGPVNRQHAVVADLTYALTDRWNIGVSAPWYSNGFAVRRTGPASSMPYFQDTPVNGIGDLGSRAKYWLFSTDNPTRNVSLSAGVKFPTGSATRTGVVSGRTVPADVSIQMGDKSWGVTTGLSAFRDYRRVSVYGAFQYLFVPRNVTGTPTFFGSLGNATNTVLNSAADQYSSQVGGAVTLRRGWPVPTVAYRVEGVPIRDVFGTSDGFRRPGMIGFIEPGVNLRLRDNLMSFSIAVRSHVDIKDSPTSTRREDATVPRYMVFVAFSRRL